MKKFLALLIISCMLMMALASCDLFGGKKTEPTTTTQQDPPPPPVCDEHIDANGDLKCDSCGADVPAPQPPACTEHKDEDGDYDCDACGYVMFEDVEYSLNISDYAPVNPLASPLISSRFTVSQGTELRARTKTFEGIEYTNSVRIDSNDDYIRISVPGTGKLTFIVENGSTSITTDQFAKITDPDGKTDDYHFSNTGAVKIEIDVTEGDWIITRGKNGGTQYYYYFHLACTVATSDESGFELVSDGKTEYIVGETLDTTGVHLNATYANGKTETLPLANVSIDTSAVDMTTSGTYPVKITYKNYSPITYYVDVYAPTSIELGFDAIEKLANNSAAGNGVYFNHSFKELYFIGEELDTRGLSVIVVGTCGEKSLKFKVDDYTIDGFDPTMEGEQTLTISTNGVSATATVHVCDVEITPDADGIVKTLVDPAYLGLRGHLSGPYHVFSTIQQALDFLAHVDPATQKAIDIAPGYYNEKLEITIPNLKIKGAGERPENVIIEWDSIYGQVDAGGFAHTTDSTATVAIRDAAVNCVIENITISNYWNSKERMQEGKLAIERALALLVQSDRFIMKNSRLLGIQDTLELFTGRQYFENVFISGYTDFVFGTNNTTYFKNCTIHTIDVDKDDNGTAGYLTAFKGSNKGEKDAIVYGAIFDGCKFTADEGVTTKQAIGRPWGAYAAVAVINSEIGGHISTVGYGTNNPRYTDMSGVLPTAETVQFVEYNNTGAGAITEAVAGMRMLTAEEAAKYLDLTVIFGTVNGNIKYLDAWDPFATEVPEDDRTYYYFNGTTGSSGTSYTYEQSLQGTTGSIGDIAIDATAGKVVARDSDTQMNQGAKLTFSVEAGTRVTVISYPGYGHYTINGVAHNANDTFSVYFAETTEVVIEATDTAYIYQIIIDPNEEAPETPTIKEVKVDGMKVDYMVGEELSLEGASVNAIYSDNSIRPITDYSVDSSAVNPAEAGEYDVVFTIGETRITVKVTYVADLLIDETTTIDLSATGVHIEGTTGTYKQLSIDATNGKFADNKGGWVQVNAGTIITLNVAEGAQVSVGAYQNETNKYDIVIVDGVCTITCNTNGYLGAITVKYTVVYDKTTTIDLTNIGTTIQGTTGEYEGLSIDATSGKFGDNGNWTQINAGTIIKLNVVEGATVSVSAYSSADNFSIEIADGVCTITCKADDYLNAITVTVE